MYHTILVAVDGSEAGYHALKEAVKLSKLAGASVEVIFVFHPQIHSQMIDKHVTVKDESGKEHTITLAEQEENGIRRRVLQIGEDANIAISYNHTIGTVTEEIILAAKTRNADLIVIGSTGKSMAGRILLGSISAAVVERSPLPVLVTREK